MRKGVRSLVEAFVYHRGYGALTIDEANSLANPEDTLAFGTGIKGESRIHRLSGAQVWGLVIMIAVGRPGHAAADDASSRFGFLHPEECKIEHQYAMSTILPAVKQIVAHGDLTDFNFINAIFKGVLVIEPPGPDAPHHFIEPNGYTISYNVTKKTEIPLNIGYIEQIGREGHGNYFDEIRVYFELKYASRSTDCKSLTASEVLTVLPDFYVNGDIELDSQTDGGHYHSEVVTYAPITDHMAGLSVSWGYELTNQIQFRQRKN